MKQCSHNDTCPLEKEIEEHFGAFKCVSRETGLWATGIMLVFFTWNVGMLFATSASADKAIERTVEMEKKTVSLEQKIDKIYDYIIEKNNNK